MKEIKAFETKDGKVFTKEEDAIEHEAMLNLRNRIADFVDRHYYSEMSRSDIENVLFENHDELWKALEG